jgi:hypothetical protein
MTLEEAEELLFFMRDEMLKEYSYNAEVVWGIPEKALIDPDMARLVGRWFYATKPDMRKYLEGRMISHVVTNNQ